MIKKIVPALLVLIALAAAIFYLYYSQSFFKPNLISNLPETADNIPPSPSIINPSPSQIPNSTPESSVEAASWTLYLDQDRGFSVKHPLNLKPEEYPDGTVAFLLFGPTQKTETEFYDGISLNFMSIKTDKKTILDFVNEERNLLLDIYGDNISDISTVNINAYKAYTFSDNFAKYIYLPQTNSQVLQIVDLSADPENMGYEEISNQIVQSLKILD